MYWLLVISLLLNMPLLSMDVAAAIAVKVSIGLTVARITTITIRPFIVPTEEEKMHVLRKQELKEREQAHHNYVTCKTVQGCQEAERIFALYVNKVKSIKESK